MPRSPGQRASGEDEPGRARFPPVSCTLPGKEEPAPEIVCRFAAQRILPLLDAYEKEVEGVKEGSDTEHLHRMRVATRRLRKYRKIFSRTRAVTRSLGHARDADVQIAHLKKMRKRIAAGKKKLAPDQETLLDALQYLLARIRRERSGYQGEVVSAIEKYERQELAGAIREAFAGECRERRAP
jgi:CHAD domain-containing protein